MIFFNVDFPRWEKKNPGHGREELTAMQALDLLVPLGNAHLPPLEAEAGAAAAGPACLTMTGNLLFGFASVVSNFFLQESQHG